MNLSYYVYGAFLMFDAIDDRHPWLEAWQSGLMLTEASLAGAERLAPDWVSMTRDLAPARGFAPKSSYDAVGIPLYLRRSPRGCPINAGRKCGAEDITLVALQRLPRDPHK